MTEELKMANEVAAMYEVEPIAMTQSTQITRNLEIGAAQTLRTQMAAQGVNLSDRDLEVLQAYLTTEQQWEPLYRRLADA